MNDAVDLAIVGAGPAGLAAGAMAIEKGLSCVVLEAGDDVENRNHDRAADLVTGVGGAGLYSDGKFSFAPSATALWKLKPSSILREAYEWVAALLRQHDVDAPAFPRNFSNVAGRQGALKVYPSEYMSIENRTALVGSLTDQLGDRLRTGAVASVTSRPGGVAIGFGSDMFWPHAAIVASGRFGSLRPLPGVLMQFRRVEIGMRVEQDAEHFALDADAFAELLDPKWVRSSADGRYEWRTFCCCRQGEVVSTQFDDLATVSGRADCPPSGRSNFGLNTRFLDSKDGLDALAQALEAARRPPIQAAAVELLDAPETSLIAESLGISAARSLAAGLEALAEDTGTNLRKASLHLPAIEGVGYYPPVHDTLRVAPAIWAAGDVTGVLRGLVPALVTGRMAAAAASDTLASR